MFHRFIDSVRHIGHLNGFDGYLVNVQRDGYAGSVTVNEAKKDYQRAIRARNPFMI